MKNIFNDYILITFSKQSALREKLEEIEKKKLEWLERMDVLSTIKTNEMKIARQQTIEEEGDTLDPNDDFKREMHLYVMKQLHYIYSLIPILV